MTGTTKNKITKNFTTKDLQKARFYLESARNNLYFAKRYSMENKRDIIYTRFELESNQASIDFREFIEDKKNADYPYLVKRQKNLEKAMEDLTKEKTRHLQSVQSHNKKYNVALKRYNDIKKNI